MKISDVPGQKLGSTAWESTRSVDRIVKTGNFVDQLNRAQDDHQQQQIESLLKDIEVQGQRLANNRTVRELKIYKELVKRFIRGAVKGAFRLKEQAGWDRRGKYKMYTTIEKVDAHLDELAKMVLEEQADQLTVLSKLDEIRGILVDIYS